MSFDESAWFAYREANLLFAETVYKELVEGDIVWVQGKFLPFCQNKKFQTQPI
jgi:trehalose-6-phosphate synthase